MEMPDPAMARESNKSGSRLNVLGAVHWTYPILGAYRQQWTVSGSLADRLVFIVSTTTAIVAVMGWIASNTESNLVLAHLSFGGFMTAIWTSAVFRVGPSLMGEIRLGVLEQGILAQSPLMLVMLGKVLAFILNGALSGAMAFFVVVAIAGRIPEVANLGFLAVSLVVSLIALVSASFILAPMVVSAGGRQGFFNGLIPFGVVFSGFFYPLTSLPLGLEIIGRLLPTAWAMEGLIGAVDGSASGWRMASDWAVALALSLLYLAMTRVLFNRIERTLRDSGSLGVY